MRRPGNNKRAKPMVAAPLSSGVRSVLDQARYHMWLRFGRVDWATAEA